MSKIIFYLFLILVLGIGILSCEKIIYPDLEGSRKAIIIDAWLNNKDSIQNIQITKSQEYFDTLFPKKLSGAEVFLTNQFNEKFEFVENDTSYIWISEGGKKIGKVGDRFTLTVKVEGETFESSSVMNRVPPIDSIVFLKNKEVPFRLRKDNYVAVFLSIDPVGVGDCYWIKTWKNGYFSIDPDQINVAYDASFNNQGVDGVNFIDIVQFRINFRLLDTTNTSKDLASLTSDNNNNPDDTTSQRSFWYKKNDKIHLEIHSITQEAFDFLTQVKIQTDPPRGFGALFAQPLSNVNTNIFNTNRNSSKLVYGFFCVSAVSEKDAELTKELIKKIEKR